MASTAPNIPQNQNCSSSDPPPTQGWDYNSQKPLREWNQGLQEQFGTRDNSPPCGREDGAGRTKLLPDSQESRLLFH